MTKTEKVMLCLVIYNVAWYVQTDIFFIEIFTGICMMAAFFGFVLCGRNRDDGESPD